MNTPTYKSLIAAALLATTSACHVSHTEFVGTGPVFPPPPFVLPEVEVNDFAWAPNSVGWVSGGETVIIEGSSTDQGWDPRDGFQFFANEPLVVDVSLDAHVFGADLDWCVWDPVVGDYTVCAETELNPEMGSFIVVPPGNEFHIVVSSYSGTTTYSMTVTFSTYFGVEASGEQGESGATGIESMTPRVAANAHYGDDHRSEVLTPTPEFEAHLDAIEAAMIEVSSQDKTPIEPIFSGPLFELD